MTEDIKIHDEVKWRNRRPGFSKGIVVGIEDTKLRVRKTSYTGYKAGLYTPNEYKIRKETVTEVNGVAYDQSADSNS